MSPAMVRCLCGQVVIINGEGRTTCQHCGTTAVCQVEFIPPKKPVDKQK